MKSILRKQIDRQRLPDKGMGLLEPLLMTVMLLIAVTAMASVFNSISRTMVSSRQQVIMQASIDTNLKDIKTWACKFTCCSGTCTTEPPTSFGVNQENLIQPCATNNPMDDRYYFPQVDRVSTTDWIDGTGTASEPLAVERRCHASQNDQFLSPLKAKVDSLAQPSYAIRTSAFAPNHVLVVKFTDTNNKLIRVENIIPKMAYFCP